VSDRRIRARSRTGSARHRPGRPCRQSNDYSSTRTGLSGSPIAGNGGVSSASSRCRARPDLMAEAGFVSGWRWAEPPAHRGGVRVVGYHDVGGKPSSSWPCRSSRALVPYYASHFWETAVEIFDSDRPRRPAPRRRGSEGRIICRRPGRFRSPTAVCWSRMEHRPPGGGGVPHSTAPKASASRRQRSRRLRHSSVSGRTGEHGVAPQPLSRCVRGIEGRVARIRGQLYVILRHADLRQSRGWGDDCGYPRAVTSPSGRDPQPDDSPAWTAVRPGERAYSAKGPPGSSSSTSRTSRRPRLV